MGLGVSAKILSLGEKLLGWGHHGIVCELIHPVIGWAGYWFGSVSTVSLGL